MLVSMKAILDRASVGDYGVAAPDVVSEFDARAAIEAAEELNAPIILDIVYSTTPDLNFVGQMCRQLAMQSKVPVAINLDHGGPMPQIVGAIQAGFTDVMADRSMLPFDQNVAEVTQVVTLAHSCGLGVEAELGHVGQGVNAAVDTKSALTSPAEAKDFIAKTGVDALAVAIGTAHGAYPKGFVPHLDFERLASIKDAVGHEFPLVLHGSSGMDNDSLHKACQMGINKVNIYNDLCRATATALKTTDLEGQKAYDIWKVAKDAFKAKLSEMIVVYGSDGKAWQANEFLGLPRHDVATGE